MLTVAPPDVVEEHANATFDAIMWSISRPGDVRQLAEAGCASIIETLLDLECVAYADAPELMRSIAVTGAELAEDLSLADHVFITRIDENLPTIEALSCGSALYPDDGATLVLEAAIGRGRPLRLSGPGINGTRDIVLALPVAFWALRERLCLYPVGFDLFVVDGRDIVGIPRSTKVEVL